MAGSLGTIMGQVRLDVRQAVAAYAALRAQNQRTIYAMRGTSEAFIASGRTMTVAGAAMIYAIGKVVMAAAEFERKMDFFAAVTDTNKKKMRELSDFTLQLAQDTIYSADEIAEGFIELGKAGVDADQIMRGIGEAMANLGAAGDIPLAESGQIITSVIQQYDLSAQKAVRVTDLLAGAANASIADITDIGVSLKYVGGVANAAGLTFEDTATAISLLAKAGIRGSTAGTSLRQMIVSLGGATGPAREVLQELGIITEDGGNKFFDAEGKAKSLSDVFQILQDATADLTQKERLMALRTIFNNRALSAASILTREGAKGFRQMNREMSKTTAADVARERLDNLSGDIEILKGNLQTLVIEAGGPFQKTMRKWVQQLTRLVQAFGDLDPKTQEMIYQGIAFAGVGLLILGAFNLVLGVIFKFIAHMKRMGPAVKFVWKLIMALFGGLRGLAKLLIGPIIAALSGLAAALGISVGVLLAIIAAIAALAAGFVWAYRNIEGFRNAVNAVAKPLYKVYQALWKFIKLLFTDPGQAWEIIKKGGEIIADFAADLRDKMGQAFDWVLNKIRQFASQAWSWFTNMVSNILSTVGSFISKLLSYFTLRNLGYVIGFAIGTVIRLFATMPPRILAIVLNLVNRVVGFFGKLAPRVGYWIGFLVGRAIRLFVGLQQRAIGIIARLIARVLVFFAKLPGRVGNFVKNMVTKAMILFVQFATEAPQKIGELVDGVVNFVQNLPTKIGDWFSKAKAKGLQILSKFQSEAFDFGHGIVNAILGQIRSLPDTIGGILQAAIDAFLSVIQSAYNAARDFAGGLWNGFRDGLGISSPSYIERAMWQITGVMDKETRRMKKQVLGVQSLSRRLAETQITRPDIPGPQATRQYARLASMQAANQNRARMLVGAVGNRGAARRLVTSAQRDNTRREFVITNWRTGEGYFRDVAQDVVDENADYDDHLGGMG